MTARSRVGFFVGGLATFGVLGLVLGLRPSAIAQGAGSRLALTTTSPVASASSSWASVQSPNP